jgi:SNF2 family DNA or RNA helicase
MSSFFDDITLSDRDDEDVNAQIEQLQNVIRTAEEEMAKQSIIAREVNSELDPLNTEEEILQRQLAEVKRQKNEKRRIADEANKLKRLMQTRQDEAQRKLQTFLSEKALRDEFENISKELDQITAGAPWREFAFDHQIQGARRLASSRRAICGDKRGLGKTLTSLIYMDMLRAKRVIVFTPRDVSGNFLREIKRWAPTRPVINMVGLTKHKRDFLYQVMKDSEEVTVVLNYESWRRDPTVIENLIDMQFDTVVIDEAHNLKNAEGLSFLGMRELIYAPNKCPYCGAGRGEFQTVKAPDGRVIKTTCSICFTDDNGEGAFWSVLNVLPMSGTTIINRPQDMWPLLNLIDKKTFPTLSYFLQDYAHKDLYSGKWRFDTGGQERLIKSLGSKYIGRTPQTAGVTFPKQDSIIHEIEMDYNAYPNQIRVMREIYEFGAIRFDKDTVMPTYVKIAEITRRRQAAVWPAGIQLKDEEGNVVQRLDAHESIKLDKAMELITSIVEEEEECVVVFSKFKEALKEMERRCKDAGIPAVRYDGDTPEHMREQIQLDFDIKSAPGFEDKRWKVFLGQYDSAATGLNLTAARQMVLIDRDWSPAREDQATGRIQRLDSVHESIVHILHLNDLNFETLGIDGFMSATMDIKADAINGFEGANDKQEELFRRLMGDA